MIFYHFYLILFFFIILYLNTINYAWNNLSNTKFSYKLLAKKNTKLISSELLLKLKEEVNKHDNLIQQQENNNILKKNKKNEITSSQNINSNNIMKLEKNINNNDNFNQNNINYNNNILENQSKKTIGSFFKHTKLESDKLHENFNFGLRDVSLSYSHDLIRNLTLVINEKQKIGLIGSNGAGKVE